jgi:hypothetical protein
VHWPLWPAPFPPFVGGDGFPNAAGAATAVANALARKTHASFLRICSPPPLWVGVRAPERVSLLRKRAPRWSESYTRSLGTTSLFRRLSRAVGNRGRCNGPAPRASVGWGFLVPWTSGAEIKNVIRPPSPGGRWLPIRTYGVLLLVHTERGRCRKFRSKRSQVAIFYGAVGSRYSRCRRAEREEPGVACQPIRPPSCPAPEGFDLSTYREQENHAHVLETIARDRRSRLRDIVHAVGIGRPRRL